MCPGVRPSQPSSPPPPHLADRGLTPVQSSENYSRPFNPLGTGLLREENGATRGATLPPNLTGEQASHSKKMKKDVFLDAYLQERRKKDWAMRHGHYCLLISQYFSMPPEKISDLPKKVRKDQESRCSCVPAHFRVAARPTVFKID